MMKEQALRLRCSGLNFRQIAEAMNIPDNGRVHRWVKEGLAEITKNVAENSEELRSIMLGQCDELTARWYPRAMGMARDRTITHKDGSVEIIHAEPDKHAVDRVLRIMDRRMKLLGFGGRDDDDQTSPQDEATRLLQERAAIYAQAGVAELTKLFTDAIRAPVTITGQAKQIAPPSPPSEPPG